MCRKGAVLTPCVPIPGALAGAGVAAAPLPRACPAWLLQPSAAFLPTAHSGPFVLVATGPAAHWCAKGRLEAVLCGGAHRGEWIRRWAQQGTGALLFAFGVLSVPSQPLLGSSLSCNSCTWQERCLMPWEACGLSWFHLGAWVRKAEPIPVLLPPSAPGGGSWGCRCLSAVRGSQVWSCNKEHSMRCISVNNHL